MRRPNNRQSHRALNTGSKAWRQIRAQVLAEQPLCPLCEAQGRIVPAVDVDHRDNDTFNNARDNLWGLCRSHHSEKSSVEMHGKEWRAKGCDSTGNPVDPDHHWNREPAA